LARKFVQALCPDNSAGFVKAGIVRAVCKKSVHLYVIEVIQHQRIVYLFGAPNKFFCRAKKAAAFLDIAYSNGIKYAMKCSLSAHAGQYARHTFFLEFQFFSKSFGGTGAIPVHRLAAGRGAGVKEEGCPWAGRPYPFDT
jgi:hypothetical protein